MSGEKCARAAFLEPIYPPYRAAAAYLTFPFYFFGDFQFMEHNREKEVLTFQLKRSVFCQFQYPECRGGWGWGDGDIHGGGGGFGVT